jgi:hypothetical protein
MESAKPVNFSFQQLNYSAVNENDEALRDLEKIISFQMLDFVTDLKSNECKLFKDWIDLKEEYFHSKKQVVNKIKSIELAWIEYLNINIKRAESAIRDFSEFHEKLKKDSKLAANLLKNIRQLEELDDKCEQAIICTNKIGYFALGKLDALIDSFTLYNSRLENLFENYQITLEKNLNDYQAFVKAEVGKIFNEVEKLNKSFISNCKKEISNKESLTVNQLLSNCNKILETDILFLKEKDSECKKISEKISLSIIVNHTENKIVNDEISQQVELKNMCDQSLQLCVRKLQFKEIPRKKGYYIKFKEISSVIKNEIEKISELFGSIDEEIMYYTLKNKEVKFIKELIEANELKIDNEQSTSLILPQPEAS